MHHKVGDIVRATKRSRSEAYHHILVWSDFDEGDDFEGIMLTTSTSRNFPDNIQMLESHFSKGHDWTWRASQHFVNRLFIKFSAWGPFTKIGQLTEEGIGFVEENLQDIPAMPFDQYIRERRSA